MINRRQFGWQMSAALGVAATARWSPAAEIHPELAKHRIARLDTQQVRFRYPRPVGKNSRLDVHGQHHTDSVVTITTDQGASGWGLGDLNDVARSLVGRPIGELIDPAEGLASGVPRGLDIALHDLAGVILGQPVYELLGSHGPTSMPIYSGMIYFDELEPAEHPGGIDKVLDNCRFDLEHGYRQLKVKIGRGNRWYANDKGLAKDIEIVNTIFDTFKTEGVEILVDANDGYSFADTIAFVEGVDQVPLLWIEEPFREDERQTRRLRDWLHGHDRSKTLVADGEHDVDHDFCMKLARQNTIDVYLNDVMQLGFSRWRQTLAELKRSNTLASPHAWGSMLKTHYAAHLNAGLGGFVTLEGVTCLSDDIDYGDYQIVDGQLSVSRQPGFGMSLAK